MNLRQLTVVGVLQAVAAVPAATPAFSSERTGIYNKRGEYQGYIAPSPYTDKCCHIYNRRGEYQGKIDAFRPRQRDHLPAWRPKLEGDMERGKRQRDHNHY